MSPPGRIFATRELGLAQDEIARALAQAADDVARPCGEPTEVIRAAYGARFGELVRVDPTGGAFTVMLPPARGERVGEVIYVKNDSASTNTVTVAAQPTETIDGASTHTSSVAWEARAFVVLARGRWGTI